MAWPGMLQSARAWRRARAPRAAPRAHRDHYGAETIMAPRWLLAGCYTWRQNKCVTYSGVCEQKRRRKEKEQGKTLHIAFIKQTIMRREEGRKEEDIVEKQKWKENRLGKVKACMCVCCGGSGGLSMCAILCFVKTWHDMLSCILCVY